MSERNASVLTSLQAIAKKASERPGYRFRDLFRLLNEEMLKDSWHSIRKNAACGVDRVSAAEYEQNLDGNIHQLVEELKRKRYRAKNVLRRYIPKGNGKLRPLGIPATQDKLLQIAVKRILLRLSPRRWNSRCCGQTHRQVAVRQVQLPGRG